MCCFATLQHDLKRVPSHPAGLRFRARGWAHPEFGPNTAPPSLKCGSSGHTSSTCNCRCHRLLCLLAQHGAAAARTLSTLAYVLNLPADREQVAGLIRFGDGDVLSSSRLIVDSKGVRGRRTVARVGVRVLRNAEPPCRRFSRSASSLPDTRKKTRLSPMELRPIAVTVS